MSTRNFLLAFNWKFDEKNSVTTLNAYYLITFLMSSAILFSSSIKLSSTSKAPLSKIFIQFPKFPLCCGSSKRRPRKT